MTDNDAHWAIAPSEHFGWDWAASWRSPDEIRNGYSLWNVSWGQYWGWSPFKWSATFSAERKARRLRRADMKARVPKIVGSVGNDDLERQFERIKKELERRKGI